MSFGRRLLLALLAGIFAFVTYCGYFMPRHVYVFDQGSIYLYKTQGANRFVHIFNGLRLDPPVQEAFLIPLFAKSERWKPSKDAIEKLVKAKYTEKLHATDSRYSVTEIAEMFVSHEEFRRKPSPDKSTNNWRL